MYLVGSDVGQGDGVPVVSGEGIEAVCRRKILKELPSVLLVFPIYSAVSFFLSPPRPPLSSFPLCFLYVHFCGYP